MEEYDWGEFAVITSLLPGYDTFVGIVQSYTDTSYFLWNLQDILTLEMSVGANDARTKRMLQQVGWDAFHHLSINPTPTILKVKFSCWCILSPMKSNFLKCATLTML